jgi:hypothetical protein
MQPALNGAETGVRTVEDTLALDVLVAFSRLLIARDQKEKLSSCSVRSITLMATKKLRTKRESVFDLEDSLDPKVMTASGKRAGAATGRSPGGTPRPRQTGLIFM